MPITKAKFKEQYERAMARVGQLKELGKTDPEIIQVLSEEKFYMAVISKIFKMSGQQLSRTKVEEDAKLADKTITEQKDNRKPIREKEIEDAAWFHNLLHDLGKHTYHKLVQYVKWTEADMTNPEHARKTLTSYIDTLQALIEDSGKVATLEDEKTFLEMTLMKYQHVLAVAVKRVELMKWYNEILIGVMTPEVRLRALNQMIAASAIRVMPEGLVKAEVEAPVVD
jgi:hypothetical protein